MKEILRILHLEDDPNDAELVRSILENEGFNCDIIRVETRDEFVHALEQDAFDIILADYSLPMFDGLTALGLVKETCPTIPFILLSGTLGEELAIDSLKAGATDYVLKHRLSRLVPSIKRALQEAEDRAQRKKAEASFKESEEKYRNLVDNISIGVSLISPNMEILTRNTQMEKWFPLVDETKKPICHQTFHVPPKDGISSHCPVCQTFSDGQRHERIMETQTGEGIKNFRIISTPIKDGSGHIINAIEMVEDITEKRKAAEEKKRLEDQLQQAQKMEAIGTLAGGIAHDFNNILSPIIIHTEMALMDLPPESPLKHNLEEVYRASERAKNLVRQILTFSRHQHQERTPLKLGIILKEVIKLLRSSLPATIDIHQDIETTSDAILADPTQIHQVILNLCTNAFHAMREKGGVLKIGLKDENLDADKASRFANFAPGNYVNLIVSDTGHGMDEETMKRIFEPYFTTKDPGEGTGMGLAVIHGIVKNYGGDITVESEPGKGTTFQIFFPKIEVDILPPPEPFVDLPRGNECVLLVDDEKVAIDAIRPMLENIGYKVTAKTSSIECLETFRDHPQGFDLVITDQTMPNMTGKELAEKLLSIRPEIPIILCTGFSEQIDENTAKEMGIKAFLMKPINMREMAKTIREVLDKK